MQDEKDVFSQSQKDTPQELTGSMVNKLGVYQTH